MSKTVVITSPLADGKNWLDGMLEIHVGEDSCELIIPKANGDPYISAELPLIDILRAMHFMQWDIPNEVTLAAMDEANAES